MGYELSEKAKEIISKRIGVPYEEIEDMKNIIKEDLLSKERSDDDVKRVNEKVKELEQRIVDIIENS